MTPLAPIAPGFHGRKPIAAHQRGRAACDSDRALDLIFGKRRRAGLELSHANQETQQIQRGRSRREFGRLDQSMTRSSGANREFPWMILRASGLKRRQPVPRKAAATDDQRLSGFGFPSQKTDAERLGKPSSVEVAKLDRRLAWLLQKGLANLETTKRVFSWPSSLPRSLPFNRRAFRASS